MGVTSKGDVAKARYMTKMHRRVITVIPSVAIKPPEFWGTNQVYPPEAAEADLQCRKMRVRCVYLYNGVASSTAAAVAQGEDLNSNAVVEDTRNVVRASEVNILQSQAGYPLERNSVSIKE